MTSTAARVANDYGLWCPGDDFPSFYICENSPIEFVGCCTQDPCTATNGGTCPQANLRPVAFFNETELHLTVPRQDCESASSSWYLCRLNNPTFAGCCASNPCLNVCPSADLRAAVLSSDPELRAALLNAGSTELPSPSPSEAAATGGGNSSGGLSTAAMGGIAGGIGGLLVLIAAAVWYRLLKRKKKTHKAAAADQSEQPADGTDSTAKDGDGAPDGPQELHHETVAELDTAAALTGELPNSPARAELGTYRTPELQAGEVAGELETPIKEDKTLGTMVTFLSTDAKDDSPTLSSAAPAAPAPSTLTEEQAQRRQSEHFQTFGWNSNFYPPAAPSTRTPRDAKREPPSG